MLTEKNADVLTPVGLVLALSTTAVPCHLGMKDALQQMGHATPYPVCQGPQHLPVVPSKGASSSVHSPGASQITTGSKSHSLPPSDLILPLTWQGIPSPEGCSNWST